MLVILLEVLLVADKALGDPTAGNPDLIEAALPASSYFAALANPVIILFSGFMIADGAEKYGLDKNIAAVMLRPFSGSARSTVLGLMLITGIPFGVHVQHCNHCHDVRRGYSHPRRSTGQTARAGVAPFDPIGRERWRDCHAGYSPAQRDRGWCP